MTQTAIFTARKVENYSQNIVIYYLDDIELHLACIYLSKAYIETIIVVHIDTFVIDVNTMFLWHTRGGVFMNG